MYWPSLLLTPLLMGIASSFEGFYRPADPGLLFRRQNEYIPGIITCNGPTDTCATACGPGYISCGDPSANLCYNPDIGQPCCEPTSISAWACYEGDFCLVEGYCCPGGLDATQCAVSFGVTLPATYVASTPTARSTASTIITTGNSVITTAATLPTSRLTSVSTQSVGSTATPAFTGAANINKVVGNMELLYGLIAFVLNHF